MVHHAVIHPSRQPTRIERWFGVRPDEERDAFAAFAVLFGIMGGHTMLETARDALFLTHLPASQLPFVYLGSAVAGFGLTVLDRKLASRASSVSAIAIYLMLGAVLTASFAFASFSSSPSLYALYLWSTVFTSWATLQFSLVTSARFDVAQAKRVLGFIGAGAIVGSVFGASIARTLVVFFPVRALLASGGVAFALTALGPLRFLRRSQRKGLRADVAPLTKEAMRGASAIANDGYARLLLLLLMASTIALTVGDFSFKAYARKHHGADLGSFFATTQIVVNVIALLVQLVVVPRVLRTAGPHWALLLLPFLLGLGGVGLLLHAALFGALVLRGADGALRFSLHKTAFDLLYFPLSETERRRIKPVLEVVGQRGGQALAALTLIVMADAPRNYVLFVLFGALSVWMGTVGMLRSPYVRLFRESLRRGDPTLAHEVRLDLHALESTVAALSSPTDDEVRLAIDLLAGHKEGVIIPTVMLLHPSPKVVLHALQTMARRQRVDTVPTIDLLLAHPDAEVRAGAVRARAQLAPDQVMLRGLLLDPRKEVAATALVSLAAHDWMDVDGVSSAIASLEGPDAIEVRLAVARAALVQPSPSLVPLLRLCLGCNDPRVVDHTVEAMELVPDESFIPLLLPLLERSRHRERARRALAAIGTPALETLTRALRDLSSPHLLRRHLPESIRRFAAAEALPVLVEQLSKERDGMVAFKVLRSLNRMRVTDQALVIDEALVIRELERNLAAAFRYAHLRSVLVRGDLPGTPAFRASRAGRGSPREPAATTPAGELLVDVLHDKRIHATERALRLVNLLLPDEDFRPVMRSYTADTGRLRASALEVLGAILPVRYRQPLLALLDDDGDASAERVLAAAGGFYEPPELSYREALKALMSLSGTTLRAIAAYHATEIGMEGVVAVVPDHAERPSVRLLEELVRLRSMVGPQT